MVSFSGDASAIGDEETRAGNVMTSAWEPTPEKLAILNAGGCIQKKAAQLFELDGFSMVGVARIELATPAMSTQP